MHESLIQQRRRQQLIEAAIKIIATEGMSATTVKKITVQAGLSKGSALYHIKSKQKLYEMVVGHVYQHATQAIGAAVAVQPTPLSKIETYLRTNLNYIIEHPYNILAVQKIANERLIHSRTNVADDATLALQHLIELGQQQAEVRSGMPPLSTAMLIRQAIDAASFYIAANPSADLSQYVEAFTNFYLQAIKTSK